ncbi:MAG TPA: SgcJ/EcaC family oxidoreductase [Acidimicrobiia bacterium]|jgi:limonene-1,2-epoxide hydrolase|nr:SgcJ/EcaC family oxidoreductase [Acidimicrobiia bacterium]
MSTSIDLIQDFCAAWEKGDIDAIVDSFTDDAVYHNIPVDPVTGKDAIRNMIAMFTTGVERIEFRVRNITTDGNVVLTERLDVFVLADKTIELPVMGAFELRDGKISAWRDYFDLNQYMSQLGASG